MNRNLQLLILRLVIGILMLLHGIAKLKYGISGIEAMLTAKGLPSFLAYGVYLGEILAPVMLIIGYRTRIGAFLLMGNLIVAILLAHANSVFSLSKHGGWALELIGLYFTISLILFFSGAGHFALSKRSRWD